MKKIVLSLLPLLLSAEPLIINSNESLSIKIIPHVLHSNISFESHSPDEKLLKTDMNKIVQMFKSFDPLSTICSGGGYQL